jgi:hypothetical protein
VPTASCQSFGSAVCQSGALVTKLKVNFFTGKNTVFYDLTTASAAFVGLHSNRRQGELSCILIVDPWRPCRLTVDEVRVAQRQHLPPSALSG